MAIDDSPNKFNQDMLIDRLQEVIDITRLEEDLSYIEVIGALEIIKLGLYMDLFKASESEKLEEEEGSIDGGY